MQLNDILEIHGIEPKKVIVMRHRPYETELRKVFPWIAEEREDLFNAYQETHGMRVESALCKLIGDGYVASFVGHEPGKAVFVGVYAVNSARPLTRKEYWEMPSHQELKSLGMSGFTDETRDSIQQFDLTKMDICHHWKCKLIVGWPGLERSWWRRAERNVFPVLAITEESKLSAEMPSWDKLDLSWDELQLIPSSWKVKLSQWRGIYLIFDTTDGLGYVGSAYGEDNILGRWRNYAATGHGGNVKLKDRDPANFRFTILQRLSPDLSDSDVIAIESSWKARLHTIDHGLNQN